MARVTGSTTGFIVVDHPRDKDALGFANVGQLYCPPWRLAPEPDRLERSNRLTAQVPQVFRPACSCIALLASGPSVIPMPFGRELRDLGEHLDDLVSRDSRVRCAGVRYRRKRRGRVSLIYPKVKA
jgi:hypothetical protein